MTPEQAMYHMLMLELDMPEDQLISREVWLTAFEERLMCGGRHCDKMTAYCEECICAGSSNPT